MQLQRLAFLLLAAVLLSGCGYNAIQSKDEGVKAAWSEVVNQYQRRADLVPNLVNTVKGYAEHEASVLEAVTNARANVGKINITADDLADEAKVKQFQQAQGELSSALSRLMVVSENYPNLKADGLFQNLQAQLEGTENRIAVERMRFNQAAQAFNTKRNSFPTVVIAGFFGDRFRDRAYFKAQAGSETAPKVAF
jgi:LemA protein